MFAPEYHESVLANRVAPTVSSWWSIHACSPSAVGSTTVRPLSHRCRTRSVIHSARCCRRADDVRGPAFAALLGHFDHAVTLPPLRFPRDDLAGLAARLLTELAPTRRVRLHPGTVRALAGGGAV